MAVVAVIGLVMSIGAVSLPARASTPRATASGSSAVTAGTAGSSPIVNGEVVGDRTEYSDTFVSNHGMVTRVYAQPVNYPAGSAGWVPIDNSLISTAGGGWANKANSWSVHLPPSLADPVRLGFGSSQVSFALAGGSATSTGSVAGSSVSYADALQGVSVGYQVSGAGVAETATLASAAAPSSLSWSLNLSRGLKVSVDGGGVVVADSAGRVITSLLAPSVHDAAGVAGPVTMSLSGSSSQPTVTVSVDPSWLSAPGRVFPVRVDPTAYQGSNYACTLDQANPTTSSCDTTDLGVGAVNGEAQRSVLQFNGLTGGGVPVDAQIEEAQLNLTVASVTGTAPTVGAYSVTNSFGGGVSWDDRYAGVPWNTAGGDYATSPTVSGVAGAAGSTFSLDLPQSLVQSWVAGQSRLDGVLLKATSESGSNLVDFDPESQSGAVTLSVYWHQNVAYASAFPTFHRQIDDRSDLTVSLPDGNLQVHATDFSIQGTGMPAVVDRYYNSSDTGASSVAYGWRIGQSADTMAITDDPGVVVIDLPGTDGETFTSNGSGGFTSPPGVDATLSEPSTGTYKLFFHQSAQTWVFSPDSCNDDAQLTSITDRNNHKITYNYSTSCNQYDQAHLASITDTQGRTITVTGNSYWISSISDPTGREVSYTQGGYQSSTLTQVTDAANETTTYTYGSSDALMRQITDPDGHIITISYDNQARVASITLVTNKTNLTGPTYTFGYNPPLAGEPDSGSTVVTDPNGNHTSYYYDHLDRVIKVVDALGRIRQASYNSDDQPTSFTDAMGAKATASYDSNNNLTSVAAPPSAQGQTAATATAAYSTSSSVFGGTYLPSASNDPQGNCSAYNYDTGASSGGNVTSVYAGQSGTCSGQTGGTAHFSATYQGDSGVNNCGAASGTNGEMCSVTDPNGHVTSYTYDSAGNLKTITPPSPLGATSFARDGLSRVTQVTDGKGQVTQYSYDGDDRVTQILYCGTSTCPTPSSTNSIAYTYDGDGNLTQTVDNTGTTTYTYDSLDRLTKKTLPSSADACSGQGGITFGYDPAGNQTSLCDASGTTTYKYDQANQLTSLTEPGGTATCSTGRAAGPAPIVAVQSATTNIPTSPSGTVTYTLPSGVAAGDALVLWVSGDANSTVAPASSVSGGGVTWYEATQDDNTAWGDQELWYGLNSSGTTGATTVTVTLANGSDQVGGYIQELSGVAASGALDGTAGAAGNSTTVTAPSVTTTAAGDIVFDAANVGYALSASPTSPWVNVAGPQDLNGWFFAPVAYQLATPKGSTNTTWTQSTAGTWGAIAVAFKAATQAAVSQSTATRCTAFSYDQDGRRTLTQFPGGATEALTYLPSGLVSSDVGKTSTGAVDTSFSYTYNNSSKDTALVQTRTEDDPGTNNTAVMVTYHYDALNRLTSAVASSGTSYYYSYDAAGNRLCAQTTGACTTSTYTYNSANELTSGPAGTYSYDSDGNETASPQLTALAYNNRNQTSSITPAGGSAQAYSYTGADSTERTTAGSTTFAPDGRKVLQSVTSGSSTYYVYDPQGNLIGEHVGSTSYYYLHDNLSSVIAVITSSGAISDRYSYDPYGKQTVLTSAVANPWGYASGYEDASTNLFKFGTRYYDPTSARWTQLDSNPGQLANLQTLDRYAYAADNPLNLIDPSGQDLFGDIIGTVGGTIGVGLGIAGLVIAPEVTIPAGLIAAGGIAIGAGVTAISGGELGCDLGGC